MAYEVLFGRHPFEPPGQRWTLGRLIKAHLSDQPPSPRDFCPDFPQELADSLQSCLRRDPADRVSCALELRNDILKGYEQIVGRPYREEPAQPLSQRADALNNKAASLWSLGLYQEARAVWNEADRIERQHVETTFNKQLCSWLAGRWSLKESKQHFELLASRSLKSRALAGMFFSCCR